MSKNLELWDKAFKTDPAATKKFTKGGGFSGTAIKPYWLVKQATEMFGPCGICWGWQELENKMVGGVWCSKVRLWYLSPDREDRGEIEQWGQTVMEGTNKHGAFVDEEAPKKAVTDAVTKCLSYLGFGGDVHMGRFDDSKYVADLANEFGGQQETPSVFKNAALRKTWCENTFKSFDDAETMEDLTTIADLIKVKLDEMKAAKNEHDLLAVDEVRKRYILAQNRIKETAKLNDHVVASFGQDFAEMNGR
jgi:hypothetical protein